MKNPGENRLRKAMLDAMMRFGTMPAGTSPAGPPLPSTPAVRQNLTNMGKGAAIALPAGAADIAGMAVKGMSGPGSFAAAGPGGVALQQQMREAGIEPQGFEHPPFSGDPLREEMGLDPEDPWGIAGEIADPSTAFLKVGKIAMAALKAKAAGGLAAMAPVAKVKKALISLANKEIVSTRRPTAVAATEDPVTEYLQVGLEAAQRDPKSFTKNVRAVTAYPNYRPKAGRTAPAARAEAFIEHVEDNLLWLHDQVPAPIRDRSAKWYDGTSVIVDRFGQNYPGLDRRQYGGVIAVLSPQKDWFQNASLAERVLAIKTQVTGHRFDTAMKSYVTNAQKVAAEKGRVAFSPVAVKYINSIEGKTLGELTDPIQQAWWVRLFDEAHNPREYSMISPEGDVMGLATKLDGEPRRVAWGSAGEIGKAISIIEDGSPFNLSERLGGMHKVRSFYNNMIDPNNPLGDVTIDTHAVAAGLLRPLSGNSIEAGHAFGGVGSAGSSVHGVQGTYPLYAEAYRRAAEQVGLLPRQMQSITWEAARGLFPDILKRNAVIAGTPDEMGLIDKVWTQYRKGSISINEARRAVHEIAEGIDPPEWHRFDTVLDAAAKDPSNTGQLPIDSLRNLRGGADSRAGTGAAAELTQEQLSRFDDRLKNTVR